MDNSVILWLKRAAEKYPEREAYKDEGSSLTFSETLKIAGSVGTWLLKKDIPEGPVAIMLEKKPETVAVFLGTAYSGHAYAPVGTDIPEDRKEKILKRLNPSFIIDEKNVEEALKCSADQELLTKALKKTAATDPLYIIFTSGSGGDPKGVLTSHLSLMNYITSFSKVMGVTEDDVLTSQSPLDYIAAIRDIYIPLLTGASDLLVPKEFFMQPERLFSYLNENRASCMFWSVSAFTILSKLKALKSGKPEYVNKVCFSGSVMSPLCLREWQDSLEDAVFVNQYGPTETTASCTYQVVDHKVNENEVIPAGKPFDNYRVFLLSPDGKRVKTGEEGEITVGGAGVTLGYINDPERTGNAYVQNPLITSYRDIVYKTGDLGVMDEDNVLYFHGRKDRQIKYLGHRVELDEIEAAAVSSGISSSAAFYDEKKEQLWLFYEDDFDKKEVALKLRERLPGFMVPRKIERVDPFPRLPNGKTDLTELKNMIR